MSANDSLRTRRANRFSPAFSPFVTSSSKAVIPPIWEPISFPFRYTTDSLETPSKRSFTCFPCQSAGNVNVV